MNLTRSVPYERPLGTGFQSAPSLGSVWVEGRERGGREGGREGE